jgi:hypothetical protein
MHYCWWRKSRHNNNLINARNVAGDVLGL